MVRIEWLTNRGDVHYIYTMDPADPKSPNSDLGDTGANDKQYDADLRNEIVHGIHIDNAVRETDISDQLMRQRMRIAGFLFAGIIATVVAVVGIRATLAYIEANTFKVALDAHNFEPGTRYTYAVSQDGEFLIDAYLIVREKIEQETRTLYRVDQVAPGAEDTYYWSIQDDGFYQYIGPDDEHPFVFVPLPLRAGKKWTRDIYPDEAYAYNKRTREARFRASDEAVLALPFGDVNAIEIIVEQSDDDDIQSIWVGADAPIVKLVVDEDENIVAELKSVERPQ